MKAPKPTDPMDAFKATVRERGKGVREIAAAAHQWAARPATSFGDARKLRAIAAKADDLAAEIAGI